ncbi:histidine kinase [Rhodanobacter sp. FW510-R12]|nr:periplasmic sensor signal transduction histidine kinase [Rhodanobacter denitrificans]KZC17189.1 histidine kinase [Rhodanobacter sp. FW104-R8]KZC21552.1 histidine kinase [Rhodanobacter denitrificans]KZC28712.1 histidine kinase [Rhodanobacter sp. FW510-T8]KZC30625.1 histidine kinase [Rhodanobacter sp. FW510-R10]
MRPRFTLRTRIILAFLAFGVVLSSLFAAVALTSMADFERILMTELLQVETSNLIAHLHIQPSTPLPASQRIYAYVSRVSDRHDVPAEMAGLPPGTHILDREGNRETYVAVSDDGAQRLYFVIDLSDIAQREVFLRWLMAGVILIGTLVSGALGLLLAGRLIAPVQRLAQWVEASAPPRRDNRLRTHFANDEVGALAVAFEHYQARLDAFLTREREFTADTSHELRSPLSVIQASVDLLAEDPTVSLPGQRAIERVRRRTTELTDLLDALLYLARHETDMAIVAEPVPVWAIWQHLVDEQMQATSTSVKLHGDASVTVLAPPRAASLVFGQLLRRAVELSNGAAVSVAITSAGIELSPWPEAGEKTPPNVDQQRSDNGFGLTLISRLCERLGWTVRWPQQPGEPLTLTFADSNHA